MTTRYKVEQSYNVGRIGSAAETEERLNEMAAKGWQWVGQYCRDWLADGHWQVERFDVYRHESK